MPYMVWNSLLNSPQPNASNTQASFTSATDISVLPQFTLPANFVQVGSALRFTAFGTLSSTGTPTYAFGIYWGGAASGTALAVSAAITTGSGVTTVPWRLELTTTWRTIGSSGTAISQGSLGFGTSASAWTFNPVPSTALATVTTDTTAAKTLTVGATCSASSGSNTVTLHGFQIESLGA